MVGAQRFSPLLGAPPTHGVLQVRAASSKKKDKAGGKKKRNTGAPKKSRYGPRGPDGAPQTSGTTAPAKPLREDLDMSELRIDALLNELVDGGEGMSNRAKFRALPVDDKIMRTIKDNQLCMDASTAGREARKLRNKELDTKITRRYVLYGDIADRERILLGLRGNKKATKFVAAATTENDLPEADNDIPEVAFAGRSNVGKSSLINAVTCSGAARSSDVPGKTQSLNFYDVSRRIRIIDMPGYGFAFAAQEKVEAWNRLMDKYLTGRKNLKRVYVVVDARHGLKAPDREMLAFLSRYGNVAYSVVLNKTDLVRPADLARRCFLIREELRMAKRARSTVHMLSTNTGAGVRLFGAELFSLANEASTSTEEDEIEEEDDDKNLSDYADYDDDDSDGEEESGRRNMLGGEWIPGQGSVQSPRYSAGGRGRGRPVGGRRSGRR
uniref:EngB-type G domain-containing protein n=1 Tax=Micromonas pusilla TaxID=38833 RepID=A0A7S0II77_MICPS